MIDLKKLDILIGKEDEDLEEEFGFNFYIETKDRILSRNVDEEKLANILFDFIGNQEIIVVKQYDGEIQEYFKMDIEDIKKNSLLFINKEGKFYDEDCCVCYSFLCENCWCTYLGDIVFFSSNEENVFKFADILDKNNIEYHDIMDLVEGIDIKRYVLTEKKIGRNEPCPCGSGKKSKKCCLK